MQAAECQRPASLKRISIKTRESIGEGRPNCISEKEVSLKLSSAANDALPRDEVTQ
jgi:hypothetical protein